MTSHEPHPFITFPIGAPAKDHIVVPVDELPQTTITESKSGRGFVVKVDGDSSNGTHTSISPASLYREAAQLIATARAMELETYRRTTVERVAIAEALDASEKVTKLLAERLVDSQYVANILHQAGLRAPAGTDPTVMPDPAGEAKAREMFPKSEPAKDALAALEERVGQTVTVNLHNGSYHTGELRDVQRYLHGPGVAPEFIIWMAGQ